LILLFGSKENKCKVFEIILEDIEGDHCEMMVSMCFCMLTSVMIRNVGTQLPESILMIIEAAQINVEDNEDVMIIFIEEEAVNQSLTLDHLSPPKVDKQKT